MKKWIFLLVLPFGMATAQPVQTLTLDDIQQWAAAHYPLLKKKSLSRESLLAANDNLGKNFLPQINVNAQASWQSDVTQVPTRIPIPGLEFETVSQDQYRAVADISQLLYDGGSTRVQKDLNELKALLSEEEVNVGLHMLKEKMNGLYLNALLLGEQRKLNALVVADLDAGLKKVEAQVENGTAFRSNIALLQSEKLKIIQRDMELQEEINGLIETMALLTGKEIAPDAELRMPSSGIPATGMAEISRPELTLYKLQDSLFRQQDRAIESRLRPKISLFANGGYGKPGLNMMKNEFAPFVTTGLRVNWNIGGFYTQKKDREVNTIYRQEVQVQQENFLLNTQAQLVQQKAVIRKLQRTLETDREIIGLKKQVKEAAKAQLDNGVITASDYLREVHAEDQGRQNLTLHQLQLLNATIQYQTIAGK